MGAGVAHGKGAHVLAANEGVHAVLPVCCRALRAPHSTAQAECRVAPHRLKWGGPQDAAEGMQDEFAISEDTMHDRSKAWSVLLSHARPLLTAMGGGMQALKTHLAGLERHGEQLTKIGGAGSYHHPGCGGGAPRLARWRAPDRWAGEAAKAGSSRSRFVRSIPDRTAKKPEFDEGCGGGRISSTTCNRGIWRIQCSVFTNSGK